MEKVCEEKINWSDSAEDSTEEYSNGKLDNRRCTYCFKILRQSSDIPEHIKTCKIALNSSARKVLCRNGSHKFICDICCRTFKHLRFLAEHEKRHEEPGGFHCKYCEMRFCTEIEREKHTEEMHKVYKCEICKEIFETPEKYIEHVKKLHNGQNREYKACNVCGRLFSSPLILKYHQDTNCGLNGPFKCEQCSKLFQTKGRLKIHKLTHSTEKNFCCSYCGQKFRHFMHLQSHEFKHTGTKPYQCNVCQKSFSHRASLATHSTTHTGLKPYLCECCGCRFSCASNIIQHRKKRPDSCGQPKYCTKLAKACPIANLKNPSLLTAEAPIRIFKAAKVIKEKEKLTKSMKDNNTPKKRRNQTQAFNCFECIGLVFSQKLRYKNHLREAHFKTEDEIEKLLNAPEAVLNCKFNLKNCDSVEHKLKTEEHTINGSILSINPKIENDAVHENIFEPNIYLKIKTELIHRSESVSSDNLLTKIVDIADEIKFGIDVKECCLGDIEKDNKDLSIMDKDFNSDLPTNINNPKLSTKDQVSANIDDSINDNSEDLEKCVNNDLDMEAMDNLDKYLYNTDKTKAKKSIEKTQVLDYTLSKGKKIIKCYKCADEIFFFKSVYIRHLRGRHHNKSPEEIDKILEQLHENRVEIPMENDPIQDKEIGDSLQHSDDLNEGKNAIRCFECIDQYFVHKSEYIRHLRGTSHSKSEEEIEELTTNINGNKPNLKCNICGKLYTVPYYFKQHLHAHDKPDENYSTHKLKDVPDENLSNSKQKKKIFQCYKCENQVFAQKSLYIRHLRGRHHNKSESEIEKLLEQINDTDSNLKCKICGKLYTISYYLKQHLKTHGIEATHKCKLCNAYFATAIAVINHTQSEHKDQLTCTVCNKIFSDLDSLVRHCQFVHSNKEKKLFICMKCGKKTSSKIALNDHELSNCGSNPIYRCDVCGKGLSTAGILKAHMMLHTNDFPHKCSYCGKGFRFNDKLKVHIRSHTGEKPFQCPYCEKSFGHSSTLYIHVSTHTGIKRYMCTGCSDRFSCISGLKAHWRTHAATCGSDPNRTTKPQVFMGYRKGKLVNKKDVTIE